jgi:hypothetical protein
MSKEGITVFPMLDVLDNQINSETGESSLFAKEDQKSSLPCRILARDEGNPLRLLPAKDDKTSSILCRMIAKKIKQQEVYPTSSFLSRCSKSKPHNESHGLITPWCVQLLLMYIPFFF